MWVKSEKGSIAIFVLTALLFMTAFLIISIAGNINKIKVIKEQQDIVRNTYSHNDGEEAAYERAYTALRNKNGQIMTYSITNNNTIELNKTYDAKLVDYKIYGNGEVTKKTLPIEYQKIEYIETTGTQYINTGVIAEPNIYVESDIMITKSNPGYVQTLMGLTTENNERFWVATFQANSLIPNCGLMNNALASKGISANTKYNLYIKFFDGEQKLYIDNQLYCSGTNTSTQTARDKWKKNNLYIGDATTGRAGFYGKIYNFKIYNSRKILIRDFVPCYRKSDNEVGMYDLVNDVFYTNVGTGKFNSFLPYEYQKVEYIETTGTQYINTGVIAEPNIYVESDIMITNSNPGYVQTLMGLTTENNERFWVASFQANSLIPNCGLMNNALASKGISANTKYNLYIKFFDGEQKLYIDNQLYCSGTNTSTETARDKWKKNNLYIGDATTGRVGFYGKIYNFKIYNSRKILIRDFVPCYRKSDNEVGMYDLVNDVFYPNAGTGTLEKGGNVQSEPAVEEIKQEDLTTIAQNQLGDLVTDENDEHYGKYKITIKITDQNGQNETIKDIYLEKTLSAVDYIDYKNKQLHTFNTSGNESIYIIDLPTLKTYEDYTKIEVITVEIPTKIEVEYYGW